MTVRADHGQLLTFGPNAEHGLHFLLETCTFEIVETADAADRATVHDERNFALATALARLPHPMALVWGTTPAPPKHHQP